MKIFNINVKRPKVLLLGNGLTYNEETKWDQIIEKLSRVDAPNIEYGDIPYSVRATIKTNISDKQRHDKYYTFFNNEYKYREYPTLEELMTIPFDAVLTTNYTYEIENSIVHVFSQKNDRQMKKYNRWTKGKADAKYMLHGFNRIEGDNITQDVWHIHGEARRKSSMILTHDEYSRLIAKIVDYNAERGNAYYQHSDAVKFESWIDYLILGDLHILGLGFDFSEFDLWWLLTRRMKEKAGGGKLFFYAPDPGENDKRKIAIENALKSMGANCNHYGIIITDTTEEKAKFYRMFYDAAIQDIRSM